MHRLDEPHIAPLTGFVREIRHEQGLGEDVPYFDPLDGGVYAKFLFLLEAPGPKAVASGFVSRNNPDESAKNMFDLLKKARFCRHDTILWNVVPWYLGDGKRIRSAKTTDLERAGYYTDRLLLLLKNLSAVILLGKKAQGIITRFPVPIFKCPHPSPQYVNRHPENRQAILARLEDVRKRIH